MRGILHALYWRLHTCYLRNDQSDALKFLAMVEDERAHGKDLLSEIGLPHMLRFEKIKQNISSGDFGRLFGSSRSCPEDVEILSPNLDKKEKDYTTELLKNKAPLLCLVGASHNSLLEREFDLSEFGRADIFIKDKRIWHAVEIKMDEATPSVVSQVDKYRLALELDMCMGLHDEVRVHVVAPGYSSYVASELSRMGVSMILHDGTVDGLRRLPEVKK